MYALLWSDANAEFLAHDPSTQCHTGFSGPFSLQPEPCGGEPTGRSNAPSATDTTQPGQSEEFKPLTGLDNTPKGGTLPGGPLPGGTLRGGTLPGGTVPGGTLPGGSLPGVTLPGGTLPGGTLPGGTVPGGTLPGGTLEGGSL